MALKVKPLGDRVLVEAVEEQEVKQGGIIIPDSAKEKPSEAKVVALGTGKSDEDGKKVAFEVKVGDVVLVSKYGGTEIKVDGKEYKILNADDILAILGLRHRVPKIVQHFKTIEEITIWQQNNSNSTKVHVMHFWQVSRNLPEQ